MSIVYIASMTPVQGRLLIFDIVHVLLFSHLAGPEKVYLQYILEKYVNKDPFIKLHITNLLPFQWYMSCK